MQYDILPGVKALIFDLDGTLADTMPYHFTAWQNACRRFGINMGTEFLQSITGAPGWTIAEAVIEENGMTGKVSPEEIIRYAPRKIDVINLEAGRFETIEIADLLEQAGIRWVWAATPWS